MRVRILGWFRAPIGSPAYGQTLADPRLHVQPLEPHRLGVMAEVLLGGASAQIVDVLPDRIVLRPHEDESLHTIDHGGASIRFTAWTRRTPLSPPGEFAPVTMFDLGGRFARCEIVGRWLGQPCRLVSNGHAHHAEPHLGVTGEVELEEVIPRWRRAA